MANVGGEALRFFIGKGLSPAAAAGIVGNMKQESSLNPNAPGGGLIQGQGGRTSHGTARQQFEGVWHELTTSERGTLSALQKAKSPQEAARIFSEKFERPGIPMLSNRERYAVEAAGGKGIAGSESGPVGSSSAPSGGSSVSSMPSFDQAAFAQANKRAILARLIASEEGTKNNPLFASGLLSTKAPQRSEYETAGGEGSPAGSVSIPNGGVAAPSPLSVGNGPPAVRGLKPVAPPVKVKLPGYITGEGYPKVEQAKHALERAEGHHVSVPELRKQVDQGAAAPHAQVIAQHPQGNVLRTDKGPVFMPHKRSGR